MLIFWRKIGGGTSGPSFSGSEHRLSKTFAHFSHFLLSVSLFLSHKSGKIQVVSGPRHLRLTSTNSSSICRNTVAVAGPGRRTTSFRQLSHRMALTRCPVRTTTRKSPNTTFATAQLVETWATPWTFAASVVLAQVGWQILGFLPGTTSAQ